jgi:hypothetical protein
MSKRKRQIETLAAELHSYLLFRAKREGTAYDLNTPFFQKALRKGIRCFFGIECGVCSCCGELSIFDDHQRPDLLREFDNQVKALTDLTAARGGDANRRKLEIGNNTNTSGIRKQVEQRRSARPNESGKLKGLERPEGLGDGPAKDLWWLAFAEDRKLLGASVVYGSNMMEAVREAWRLDINPGGAVIAYDMEDIPPDMIGRFTPVAELVSRGLVTPKAKH